MFGKLFLKEWKEKINIFLFALAFQAIFVFIVLAYSAKKGLIELLTSAMILIFFPLVALLLGSSAFYSEFKDGAWAFLFSRPAKKWKIWLVKYLSLLSILLSLLVVFFFLIQVLPHIKEILESYQFPVQSFGDRISLLLLGILLPLYAFTIAFSISFLSEKQFVVIFSSIFIIIALDFILYYYYKAFFLIFPQALYFFLRGTKEIFLLLSALAAFSFFFASILAFSKSDFSQQKKKIFYFSKFVLLFLIVSLAVSTAWTAVSGYFFGRDYIHNWHTFEGDAYFTSHKGIFRFDAKEDRLEKIGKSIISFMPLSMAKGKIAFFNYRLRNDDIELWLMNKDGSQRKRLAWGTVSKDSPFYHLEPWSCFLSANGEKVALTTLPQKKKVPILFWMNSDGTRLRSKPLDFPLIKDGHFRPEIIAWTEGNNLVILLRAFRKFRLFQTEILIFNPETEMQQILAEKISRPYEFSVSPRRDFLVFCYRKEIEEKEIFSLLNLNTLEKEEIYKDDFVVLRQTKWSEDGEKLAFLIEKTKTEFFLGVYSLKEKRVVCSRELSQDKPCLHLPRIDWVFGDQKLALSDTCKGYVHVLDGRLDEEKKIKIPDSLKNVYLLFGLEKGALFKELDREKIWRLNLETEEWKKVY